MSRQVRGHAAFLIFFGPSPRVRRRREEEEGTASLTECQVGYSGAQLALIPFYGSAEDRGAVGREWRTDGQVNAEQAGTCKQDRRKQDQEESGSVGNEDASRGGGQDRWGQ